MSSSSSSSIRKTTSSLLHLQQTAADNADACRQRRRSRHLTLEFRSQTLSSDSSVWSAWSAWSDMVCILSAWFTWCQLRHTESQIWSMTVLVRHLSQGMTTTTVHQCIHASMTQAKMTWQLAWLARHSDDDNMMWMANAMASWQWQQHTNPCQHDADVDVMTMTAGKAEEQWWQWQWQLAGPVMMMLWCR